MYVKTIKKKLKQKNIYIWDKTLDLEYMSCVLYLWIIEEFREEDNVLLFWYQEIFERHERVWLFEGISIFIKFLVWMDKRFQKKSDQGLYFCRFQSFLSWTSISFFAIWYEILTLTAPFSTTHCHSNRNYCIIIDIISTKRTHTLLHVAIIFTKPTTGVYCMLPLNNLSLSRTYMPRSDFQCKTGKITHIYIYR